MTDRANVNAAGQSNAVASNDAPNAPASVDNASAPATVAAPVAAFAAPVASPEKSAWMVNKKSGDNGCTVYTFCTPCAEGMGAFLFVCYEKYEDGQKSRVRVGQHWGDSKDSVQSGSYVWTGDAGSAKPFTFMDRRWSRDKGYYNVRGGDWFDFGDAASREVYKAACDMLFANKSILVKKSAGGDELRFNTAMLEDALGAEGISCKEITDAIDRERL